MAARPWWRGIAIVLLTVSLPARPVDAEDEPDLVRLDGSTVSAAEIETRIAGWMEAVRLPGMAIAVLHDGELVLQENYGVRDVRDHRPLTEATSFAGLSFSKTITAYLAMRLVDQGRLDLDRPLAELLPASLPTYDFYTDLEGDERHRALTARHVLTHTTGWPNWRWFTPEDRLSFLYEPGERHSYSGEGFAFLQLAIEEHTGKGFEELAQEEVFAPLGMKRSSMVWQERFETDYAEDHDLAGRPLRRERRDEPQAAGSLQTTAVDYARFLRAVLTGEGLSDTARRGLVSRQVQVRHRRMFGPLAVETTSEHEATGLGWTLGWGYVETPFGPAIFHTGNDVGSANYSIAFLEPRVAVVLMGNSQRLEGIAADVVALLTGDRSSPFDYLGYRAWDAPWQQWLNTLAAAGVEAGRKYWREVGDSGALEGLEDEESFRWAATIVARERSPQEALEVFAWRRELFPESIEAIREEVRFSLDHFGGEAALRSLEAALGSGEREGELDWFHAWLRALHRPVEVDPARLERFAGEYEVRRVELRDGRLFYGRDATRPEDYAELFALAPDTFVLRSADFFRLRFETDESGAVTGVTGLYEDGRTDSNTRTRRADER